MPMNSSASKTWTKDDIVTVIRRYWGFSELRPLQEDAIRAGLERRDSLVVMPTGGGKSLCYEVPAELEQRTDVVVSPLIALMKDQVDGLRECGYPAAALYSGIPAPEVRTIEEQAEAGRLRLLFVAPERLLTPRFLQLVERLRVRAFSIDEAHCISHWGHDFRPEYRQLAELKTRFPKASVHAYTATATERVRSDIIEQLRLQDASVLVGTFDRPNLVYRVIPRIDARSQTHDVLLRHRGEAAIVYCISRKDAEAMADSLQENGVRAAFYHAGMDADARRRTQDEFASEEIDVIAATVAFGMGIDRSDVRAVIHSAMPKSIEHYQQETGRAGRDGLEAECVLLYSAADVMRWESLIERAAADADVLPQTLDASRNLLQHMRRFCSAVECRHRRLSEYFGQPFLKPECGACDVCLNEIDGLDDATVTAQKILSCVARTGQRFGAEYVLDVLLGANTERIRQWNHDQIKTFGLMKGTDRKALTNLLYQLVDNGVLERTTDDRPVLKLNDASWAVMRGQRTVKLIQAKATVRKTKVDEESWEGVDRGLFEELRQLRRQIADDRGVPPYVLFSDATLRDLSRLRPGSPATMRGIRGIGERKLIDLGDRFLGLIAEYCRKTGLKLNETAAPEPRSERPARLNEAKALAFKMFADGARVEDVAAATGRAISTAWSYLVEFVESHPSQPLDPWLDQATCDAVIEAGRQVGTARLMPIHERLEGKVSFEHIRIALARSRAMSATRTI
jgi:ATP-dependent DNA helicase RecQ